MTVRTRQETVNTTVSEWSGIVETVLDNIAVRLAHVESLAHRRLTDRVEALEAQVAEQAGQIADLTARIEVIEALPHVEGGAVGRPVRTDDPRTR